MGLSCSPAITHTRALDLAVTLVPVVVELAEGRQGWALVYFVGFSGMAVYLVSLALRAASISIRAEHTGAGKVLVGIKVLLITSLGMPLWAFLVLLGAAVWPLIALGLAVARMRGYRAQRREEQEEYEELVEDIREERAGGG